MSGNVAASVKARLLKVAHERGEQLQLVLVRYACERFLYRLGATELRGRCILKGAGLLVLWMDEPYRSTRDVDLLAFGISDESDIRDAMRTICRVPCPEDGLEFDLSSLVVSPIREEQRYAGQRAVLRTYLGKARITVQIDFGFGDAVPDAPEDAQLPTLIERVPRPRIRVYPRVGSVAEKFEAMVQLGRRNSRMKDFHDIWALSEAFAFEGPVLRKAVATTFERRHTPWTSELPEALTAAFYSDDDVQTRWRGYLRAGRFRAAPPGDMESVGQRMRLFLGPVRASIVAGEPFEAYWPAGGPWQVVPCAARGGERQ